MQVTREIFAQSGLGVRELRWQFITVAEAGGYTTIDSVGESKDLTDDWYGAAGGLDVFIVRNMLTPEGYAGVSATEGPCKKNDKDELTGSVTSLGATTPFNSGVLMAHEVAHFLGLEHTGLKKNLMNPSIATDNTQLTVGQGNNLRSHCWVSDSC